MSFLELDSTQVNPLPIRQGHFYNSNQLTKPSGKKFKSLLGSLIRKFLIVKVDVAPGFQKICSVR